MATKLESGLRDRLRIDELALYDVYILNDDFTEMFFVVEVLMQVFGKPQAQAVALMLEVHHSERGLAGTYVYDIAKSKVDLATRMARQEGFPLRFSVEKKI